MLLLTALLSACASQLTREGSMTRQIPIEAVPKCGFLGTIIPERRHNTLNSIRNPVVAMGGNAFALNQIDDGLLLKHLQAEAYRCPGTE